MGTDMGGGPCRDFSLPFKLFDIHRTHADTGAGGS